MFFFPVYPKGSHANIVGESMHDVPLIFEFYLLCMLQITLAVYLLLLWIRSSALWRSRITGFQGKWSAGWSGEVAGSKVKRLCTERSGQHPDLGGTAVLKGWDWAAWISIPALSEECALASSQNQLSSSHAASSPDPATPSVCCTIPFPSISLWEMLISEIIVPVQTHVMFCKGWKAEAQGWIVATQS